jgi:predicted permease
MSLVTGWLYTLRALFRRNAADRDMADEIAFHVERQAEKHKARGLGAREARRLALREFGGTTRWREEARQARGAGWLDLVEQDLRQTTRSLRRDPIFATTAIVTLALAIGANAAMFKIIDRMFVRGPEYVVDSERLVRLYVTRTTPAGKIVTSAWQPYALYASAREHVPALANSAAYRTDVLRFGSGADARRTSVIYATADFFALTGVHPALGRFYDAEDDRVPTGRAVVVLGWGFWQRELGADPAVIGKTVMFGDRAYRVVGVAPRGFTGVEHAAIDAWIPLSARPLDPEVARDWTTTWRTGAPVAIVGRLSTASKIADEQLTTLLRDSYVGPDRNMHAARVTVRPTSYDMRGIEPAELGVARLLAAVAMVMLLVAAANTMNLVLARAIRRQRELGVRVALGAGRWRIARMMVTESVMMALFAAVLGLLLAHWGGAVIQRALLPNVAWTELPVDARVFAWTTVAALATGIVVGLIPALRARRTDVAAALRGGRDGVGGNHAHSVVRASLQVVQLTLCLVLLYTAGLFVRSLRDIHALDLGYDRDRVLEIEPTFAPIDTTRRAEAAAVYRALGVELARLPGVADASIAFGSPLSQVIILSVRVPGGDSLVQEAGIRPIVTAASPGYFATVGTRIVRGRDFSPNEGAGTEPVVVVGETMARELWPRGDPIGHCVIFGNKEPACARVIGVVQDVHHVSLREPGLPQCYIPWGQDVRFIDGSVLLVRARGDARDLIPGVMQLLHRVGTELRAVDVQTLEQALDPQVRPWRVGATLFGLFGAIVALVAAIGLFSVVSYLVAQRTREIGIRIALGAQRANVLRLVLGSGLRTASVGALLGGGVAMAIAPFVQPLLFDNRARDPWLLGGVVVGLLATAFMASLLPSLRATRVDPLLALRAE